MADKIEPIVLQNALAEIGEESVLQLHLALTEAAVSLDPSRSNLARSNLVLSMKAVVNGETIQITANDYWRSIEEGRPPQQARPLVPFGALLFWAKRYRIRPRAGSTEVSMIKAIQRKIIIKGYAARPFVGEAQRRADVFINPFMDRWTQRQLDTIFTNFR